MATVVAAAPRARQWRRAELPIVAALALAALIAALLVPTYPNYDTYFHLVWGRELMHGMKPDFQAYAAPTEHPLFIALCAVVGLIGTDGDRAIVIVCVLSLVALVWGTFRVGDACFGPWPGLLAAAFVGSSFAFLLYAARAYVDVPFLALVIWAAAMEARSPRRGLPVMVVLAVAGLMRPEAWVLAGAYWLWCGWRRFDLLALAAAAPVLWCLVDLWVTGDPLFSLHATSDLADELNRNRGLSSVPGSFVSFVTDTARWPVALAGVAGAALVWRLRAGRALHVPIALFGAGVVTFLATGLAGLSVLPRYLTVPVIAVCLFAGYGVAGFTTLQPGRLRRLWSRAAIGAAVLGAAFVVIKAPVVGTLRGELRFIRGSHDSLVAILHSPPVQRDLRCGPITYPNYRLVPDTRWLLDLPARRVGARSARRRSRGVAMFVLGTKELKRFGFAAGASPTTNVPDPGFVPIARNARFAAYAACG
ncbi:MAG TPA: glycosyltransferase family 39 protein [Solirubrobacteraceae bacterium]|nr:glycosyltransferase family 39 protein [Solirubrobacteraceae bacterium]